MTDTIRVTLPPDIDGGGHITMRQFTTRDLLGILRKEMSNVELIEMTLEAIVEYLPDKDPLDLPPDKVPPILDAWMLAKKEEALPPATAEPSAKPSRRRRSATSATTAS